MTRPSRATPIVSAQLRPLRTEPALGHDIRPATEGKVGVLLTSHGDIDSVDQLRAYTREAVYKNPGIPIGRWARGAIDSLGWPLVEKNLKGQYAQIGATNYHANSLKQAAAVTDALGQRGIDGQAYVGYNFVPPMIPEAVETMRRDGVDRVVVFNQGAQNSIATMGESIGEVREAIDKDHKDWNAEVIAVTEFNDDPRFLELLKDRLVEDAQKSFSLASPEEICLLITSHGLPKHLIDKGDKAVKSMLKSVAHLKRELQPLGYQVEHGFLNDDFFPGSKWTKPDAEEMAQRIVTESLAGKRTPPKHILVDGRLSFTVHHRATLFDGNVQARAILEPPARKSGASWPGAEVTLAPNFDGDPRLAGLYADLTREALEKSVAHPVVRIR